MPMREVYSGVRSECARMGLGRFEYKVFLHSTCLMQEYGLVTISDIKKQKKKFGDADGELLGLKVDLEELREVVYSCLGLDASDEDAPKTSEEKAVESKDVSYKEYK